VGAHAERDVSRMSSTQLGVVRTRPPLVNGSHPAVAVSGQRYKSLDIGVACLAAIVCGSRPRIQEISQLLDVKQKFKCGVLRSSIVPCRFVGLANISQLHLADIIGLQLSLKDRVDRVSRAPPLVPFTSHMNSRDLTFGNQPFSFKLLSGLVDGATEAVLAAPLLVLIFAGEAESVQMHAQDLSGDVLP
jgi:hypothetical protein